MIFAALEIPLTLAFPDRNGTSQSTLVFLGIRIVRLGRVARILRVVRFHIFKDLVKMLSGALGGLRTLFWSMILIAVPLYMMAVVLRESLGRHASAGEGAEN